MEQCLLYAQVGGLNRQISKRSPFGSRKFCVAAGALCAFTFKVEMSAAMLAVITMTTARKCELTIKVDVELPAAIKQSVANFRM